MRVSRAEFGSEVRVPYGRPYLGKNGLEETDISSRYIGPRHQLRSIERARRRTLNPRTEQLSHFLSKIPEKRPNTRDWRPIDDHLTAPAGTDRILARIRGPSLPAVQTSTPIRLSAGTPRTPHPGHLTIGLVPALGAVGNRA